MFRCLLSSLAIVVFASVSLADDAKAVIEKAIKAAGWDKAKGRFQSWSDRGSMILQGQEMKYDAEWKLDSETGRYRFDLKTKFGGNEIDLKFALNGDKAIEAMGDMRRDVDGKKLETVKESGNVYRVASLKTLLTGKDDSLSVVKVKDVNQKPMVGVEVKHPKFRTIILSFDRESGLLMKSETVVMNEFDNWKDIVEEAYYLDWSTTGDVKSFATLHVDRGGKRMIVSKLSNSQFHEKPTWEKTAFMTFDSVP